MPWYGVLAFCIFGLFVAFLTVGCLAAWLSVRHDDKRRAANRERRLGERSLGSRR